MRTTATASSWTRPWTPSCNPKQASVPGVRVVLNQNDSDTLEAPALPLHGTAPVTHRHCKRIGHQSPHVRSGDRARRRLCDFSFSESLNDATRGSSPRGDGRLRRSAYDRVQAWAGAHPRNGRVYRHLHDLTPDTKLDGDAAIETLEEHPQRTCTGMGNQVFERWADARENTRSALCLVVHCRGWPRTATRRPEQTTNDRMEPDQAWPVQACPSAEASCGVIDQIRRVRYCLD